MILASMRNFDGIFASKQTFSLYFASFRRRTAFFFSFWLLNQNFTGHPIYPQAAAMPAGSGGRAVFPVLRHGGQLPVLHLHLHRGGGTQPPDWLREDCVYSVVEPTYGIF